MKIEIEFTNSEYVNLIDTLSETINKMSISDTYTDIDKLAKYKDLNSARNKLMSLQPKEVI